MKPPSPLHIVADVRRSEPPWLFQGLVIGALFALLCPAISLAAGISPVWLPGASAAWRIAHLSARTADTGIISGMLATQAAFIFAAPILWRWLGPLIPAPDWLDDRIVDARSIGAFQARKLDSEGLDVLVYVDLYLRRGRIVAGVDATRQIAPVRLERATDALTRGIETGDVDEAVQQAVAHLGRTR